MERGRQTAKRRHSSAKPTSETIQSYACCGACRVRAAIKNIPRSADQYDMSYRARVREILPGLVLGVCWLAGAVAQGQVVVTPANVNVSYVQGATLPAAQKLTVNNTGGGTPSYTASLLPAGPSWITATPDTGVLPATVNLRLNPTGLQAGVYKASVVFTAVGVAAPGTTNVTLTVTAPPPTLTASAASLTYTTILATPTPPVAPQTVQLSTSGIPISFSVSAGTATWLTVSPATGFVLPGAPVTLTITADPTTLAPAKAAYKAKITITATSSAANKTIVIPVTFAVLYQTPTVTGIWPPNGKVGGPATTVTIYGSNFNSATIAKISTSGAPVSLKTTYYSPDVISAVIPAPQLVAGAPLNIYASNPAPGGDSAGTVTFGFGQTVDAAVNAASYLPGGSPGDLITLFGQNIGPPVPASLTETVPGYVDKSLGGFSVTVDGVAAAMVYASQNQITVQVPYEVDTTGVPSKTKAIVVTNGSITANGQIDIAPTAPGIFTVDASGAGQAAALNQDGTLNSSTNQEKIGKVVVLYLTGEGVYTSTPANPPGPDGFVIPTGDIPMPPSGVCPVGSVCMPALAAAVSVTLGPLPGAPPGTNPVAVPVANIQYAGPFVGGMLGIMQLNLLIPAGSPTGTAVPIQVTIGGVATQPGVTIALKP